MAAIQEAKKWETSSANTHGFSVEAGRGGFVVSALDGQVHFTVSVPPSYPSSALSATSEDEDLAGYLCDLNDRGAAKVVDFLNSAAKLFSAHFEVEEEDEDDEDAEEEDEEDDVFMDMPDLSQIKAQRKEKVSTVDESEFEEYAVQFKSSTGPATDRLMKDLKNMYRINKDLKFGFTAEPADNDLYLWHVKFYFKDPKDDGAIAEDMAKYKRTNNQDYVLLEMKFEKDYPFSPPFIRVVKPRFQFHTGHVTIGGSICMELLTSSGWSPTNEVEGVLVQIRSEMIAGGARIDLSNNSEYTDYEARAAFIRVARQHGWEK